MVEECIHLAVDNMIFHFVLSFMLSLMFGAGITWLESIYESSVCTGLGVSTSTSLLISLQIPSWTEKKTLQLLMR